MAEKTMFDLTKVTSLSELTIEQRRSIKKVYKYIPPGGKRRRTEWRFCAMCKCLFEQFAIILSKIEKRNGAGCPVFCGKSCSTKWTRRTQGGHATLVCPVCGQSFRRRKSILRIALQRNKCGEVCCSVSCSNVARYRRQREAATEVTQNGCVTIRPISVSTKEVILAPNQPDQPGARLEAPTGDGTDHGGT
jgi:hypothetical protein